MKCCAVICELNPFHNGHEYIFQRAREVSGCDKLIALMSGSFVQRAVPACMSARDRADIALHCGADAVLELPVIYASASGDVFARGAIDILNTMPDITHLVMGAENDDYDLLLRIADIKSDNNTIFSNVLSSKLSSGLPFARAQTEAICDIVSDISRSEVKNVLTRPNNILAIAYATALINTKSKIVFMPVRRNDSSKFISASTLRNENLLTASSYMPGYSYEVWRKSGCSNLLDKYGLLIMYALRESSPDKIAMSPDCAEGFEYKLKELSCSCKDFNQLIDSVPTSRFTRGRIMRICLHTLLGITKEMQHGGYNFSRLIGVREDSKSLLSTFPPNILTGKRDEVNIPEKMVSCFDAERRASDIWNLLALRPCDFYSRIITI